MARSRVDLIAAIARRLRSKVYSSSEVRTVVRFELEHNLPQQLAPPTPWCSGSYPYGRQADNRQYADDIKGLVKQLVQKIEAAPAGTRNALLILASRTEPEKWSLHDPNSPAARAFRQRLLKGLADLQRACDDILDERNTIGEHHNRDRAKDLCAGCALDLIVGLEVGKPTNSPVRDIADDLFLAISPTTKSPNLRRHCEAAIETWLKMSEPARSEHIDQVWADWELTRMVARKPASSV